MMAGRMRREWEHSTFNNQHRTFNIQRFGNGALVSGMKTLCKGGNAASGTPARRSLWKFTFALGFLLL